MHNTVPRMYNVCRIPQAGRDRLSTPSASSIHHKKVIVMIHDWIYSIDVYGAQSSRSVDHTELERRIRGVVIDSSKRLASGERGRPVSVMTSDDRDIWSKV